MSTVLTDLLSRMDDEDINSYIVERIKVLLAPGGKGSPGALADFWRRNASDIVAVLDTQPEPKPTRQRKRLEGNPPPQPLQSPPQQGGTGGGLTRPRQKAATVPEGDGSPVKRVRRAPQTRQPVFLAQMDKVKAAIVMGCETMGEIVMHTGLSKTEARSGIEALVQDKLVSVTGTKRWTRYAMTNGAPAHAVSDETTGLDAAFD